MWEVLHWLPSLQRILHWISAVRSHTSTHTSKHTPAICTHTSTHTSAICTLTGTHTNTHASAIRTHVVLPLRIYKSSVTLFWVNTDVVLSVLPHRINSLFSMRELILDSILLSLLLALLYGISSQWHYTLCLRFTQMHLILCLRPSFSA